MKSTWDTLTVEEKLEVTEHIFRQLNRHLEKGGSFRHLISDRLKLLHPTAYSILFDAGGQDISNALNDAKMMQERETKRR